MSHGRSPVDINWDSTRHLKVGTTMPGEAFGFNPATNTIQVDLSTGFRKNTMKSISSTHLLNTIAGLHRLLLTGLLIATLSLTLAAEERTLSPERSVHISNRPREVTIQNVLPQPVQVRWVDFEGKEQDAGQIPPRESVQMTSYRNHLFRFFANGEVAGTYVVNADDVQTYEILPEWSFSTGVRVGVTFVNNIRSQEPVDVVWVDSEGKERVLSQLKHQEEYNDESEFGHLWRFKLGGTVVAEYRVTNAPKQHFDVAFVHPYSYKNPHPPKAEWGYSGKIGPEYWGDLHADFKAAKVGQSQSPIDIQGAQFEKDLPSLEFSYKPEKLNFFNNGHTLEEEEEENEAVSFAVFDGHEVALKQFHFHSPSEHTVDGKPYDMEMHLVHKT
ncbi:MAG: carbonic anhydrase family protein, partial [Planctomycetaceae bacterium]|nr:carbonic anhydrase family protein [Planctomycetaceae bacterium]